MDNKINNILLQHIGKQDIIDMLHKDIQNEQVDLIEVIGGSGSGKTFLIKRVCEFLEKEKIDFDLYITSMFNFNQFERMFMLLTDLTAKEYNELLEKGASLTSGSKYDFFYYLVENVKKLNKIPKKVLIIENADAIDRYTLDFIQFFAEDTEQSASKIITFSKEELFSFSTKHRLPFLAKNDIQKILTEVSPPKQTDIDAQAEIFHSISGGDIYIIEHILNEIKSRKQEINLATYLESKISVENIYAERIGSLNKNQLYVLITVFFMDSHATEALIKEFLATKKTDTKSLAQTLKKLQDLALIDEINGKYYLKKVTCFHNYYISLPKKEKDTYYKEIVPFVKEKILSQGVFKTSTLPQMTYDIMLHNFDKTSKLPSENSFIKAVAYLSNIKDHENLLTLYSLMAPLLKKEVKTDKEAKQLIEKQIKYHSNLGVIYKKLNRFEEATNSFREALKISVQHKVAIDEVVFELANALYKLNSLAFASEVITKYSSSVKDTYWMCKLKLLKADIQIELNNASDARKYIDEVYEEHSGIEDEEKKQTMFAEIRKLMGKIYYYTNQWDKAEVSFIEAGKIFASTSNREGEAAIYNNLGVLKMYRGEWEETESLYSKSLEIEKSLYNLEGVSICYNNLGGLWADRGNYKKSLDYLNEALKIQKLLNDRYNICNIYNNIGVTYMDNGEYDKAEESLLKAQEVAKNFNLLKNHVAALNNLGASYFKSGKWSEAVKCYEEAIDKSEKSNLIDGLCKSYNNLGELHEKRADYELAYDLYFKASNIIPQLNDEYQKAEIWGNMGSVLTHLHNFSEAYGYLVESFDFFKALNTQEKIIEGCHKMAYYFITTSNYESANYYLDLAQSKAEDVNSPYKIGETLYLRGLLLKNDPKVARPIFEKAVKLFVETKNYYELALANYELAYVLNEENEWQQALDILTNNKHLLKDFGANALIEKNDILLQRIEKEYEKELKETKNQEYLLTKFYETTNNLKSISSFDTLLEYTLDSFVDLAEADGGIICLYNSRSNPDSWEYMLFHSFSAKEKDYSIMMGIIHQTFQEGKFINYKQPDFASQYNNIASFPLSFQNQNLGVILLFTKYGGRYIPDKVSNLLNALCNQAVVIIENFRHHTLTRSHAIIREELSSPQLFTNIIGKSETMEKIFNIIEKVKDTPTTVLLEGQSGTGKELIARAIHYSSIRRNKKFIAQYCGSLPETLLESELFGHVKGSFTGAAYDKKGLFEVADGGTFFLDEIADISLSTQAKLLRFLQEGEIKRVGSTKTQKVDVRVICATNVSLKDKIQRGEFRLDLYYRLNVIRVEVPRLVDRKSDIPLLAIHFLDKYNKKMNKNVKGITDETMRCFSNYEWPGNIRQLENEIERAVTLVDDEDYIEPADLSEEIYRYTSLQSDFSYSEQSTLKEAVQTVEKNLILAALKRNDWNQSQSAKELGISRQGLIKKMKRYELDK